MKQLRSGGESWSGWTLTRWRRSFLLMKLKSSEMPLRSVFIFALIFCVIAFRVSWEVETILKTKGSHRCLTKMETDGSAWLSWARWWQTLAKKFPQRSKKALFTVFCESWNLICGYMDMVESRRKASSPNLLWNINSASSKIFWRSLMSTRVGESILRSFFNLWSRELYLIISN